MFHRISNSWRLFGSTLNVLGKDRELVLFPILSGLASLILIASFAGSFWGLGLVDNLKALVHSDKEVSLFTRENLPIAVLAFAFYFVNYFVIIYFNSALVGAAFERLSGGDPTVASGLRAANCCLPAILGYTAIAATVGLLLDALQQKARDNWIGRLVVSLIGMAWTLITYLVIPVLVIERLGPFASVKRSAAMLRDTWGEQIIANFGFGFIGMLLGMVGVCIAGIGIWIGVMLDGNVAVFLTAIGLAVVYWIALAIVLSALRGIYTAALYAYASDQPPMHFPSELLSGAFSTRSGR